MNIQDNVIKQALKSVYFICGTACGGKSTAARTLARRHGYLYFDVDTLFDGHRLLSDPEHQPYMNTTFANADAFFDRTAEDYKKWLLDGTREQWDFIIMELAHIAREQTVLCDCHLTVDMACALTVPDHLVFLVADPTNIVETYCNRPDHGDFKAFIESASDVAKAKALVNTALGSINIAAKEAMENSEFFCLERDFSRTPEQTAALIEQHFGWKIHVEKLKKDTRLAEQFVDYAESCSWIAGPRIAQGVKNWAATDWEAEFVALDGDKIVGFGSIAKEDYYPDKDIFPWVSGIFVDEAYRGQGICGKLVNAINVYAKEQGFTKTYTPTEYIGLYEHYGYRYLKDLTNYGGDVDHLFVKEL